jgi:hypothetical protein
MQTAYLGGTAVRNPTLCNNIFPAVSACRPPMRNAVQTDTDDAGTAYPGYIDNMKVTYTQ